MAHHWEPSCGHWDRGEVPRSPLGHRLLFVMFICLAFVLFAPTVLLPVFQQHSELLAEEARLQDQIKQLEEEVRRRAELTDAFRHDSLVNERLAVLDLAYRKPNQEILEVRLPDMPAQDAPAPTPAITKSRTELNLPPSAPAWALKWERWAKRRGLIELFLDPTLRPVFLLMSGGLLIAAFVLFAPRVRHAQSQIGGRAPLLNVPRGPTGSAASDRSYPSSVRPV